MRKSIRKPRDNANGLASATPHAFRDRGQDVATYDMIAWCQLPERTRSPMTF